MSRRIRGPVAGKLVEVTTRTVGSRYLLKPCSEVNAVIKGVLAQAQQLNGMKICSVVAMSNHVHLLLCPKDAQQLAKFMAHVNSNIARRVGRYYRWRGPFWSRRYEAIPVSDDEQTQVARLRYLLAHGVKEGLVPRPQDWLGVNAVAELCSGLNRLYGIWRNNSKLYEARRRQKKVNPRDARTMALCNTACPYPTKHF